MGNTRHFFGKTHRLATIHTLQTTDVA